MMFQNFSLSAFALQYPGKMVRQKHNDPIADIAIDSRKVLSSKATLFIAIEGHRFNGAQFAEKAYHLGVRDFILAFKDFNDDLGELLKEANIFLVEETLLALQFLGKINREQFKAPIVGVTGSNGKTIVKEWLSQVLLFKYRVCKTPKSFNSQIGVPLSVLGLTSFHQVGVFEAGISFPGEMQKLKEIIQPNLGILTNIGTAHDENFHQRGMKLREKCLLFTGCQYIVYRKDSQEIDTYLQKNFDHKSLVSWSDKAGADYTLSIKPHTGGSKIILFKPDLELFTFYTSFRDLASLENIRHVIVAGLTLGLKPPEVQKGLEHLNAVDMRLTLKKGINGCSLVDDTYNNDLAGLEIALEFLSHQRKKRRRVLLLSDMVEEGESHMVYSKTAQLISHYGIDHLFGVGKAITKNKNLFGISAEFFPDTPSLIKRLHDMDLREDLVLIKGARIFNFENIVRLLEEKIHGTVLEINLNALSHNYNFYKKWIKPETKIMIMVKAFAYGGGSAEIANHLQGIGADYLAVAYADEGVYLRKKGIQLPIMVMNPSSDSLYLLGEYKLEPAVYSISFLRHLIDHSKDTRACINVHLELDTGMHRLGLGKEEMDELLPLLKNSPKIRVTALFTHLAGADEAVHETYTMAQIQQFSAMSQGISADLKIKPIKHVLNSAGIIRYPDYAFDMVRLGIGLYGVEVNGMEQGALKQVGTLKTVVSQVRSLQKGDTIGYGRRGAMMKKGKIATIAIGYADGFDRRFSNGVGHVMIHKKNAPVIGNVCMDMCMVDVTGIDVKEGDEVLVYGEDLPLQLIAEKIGTIPYELLTKIGSRVKRLYILD